MSTTLLQIRTDVREMLRDTDPIVNNRKHTNGLIDSFINKECRSLHNHLAKTDRSYKLTKTEFIAQTDAVTGTDDEQYTLPADFFSFVAAVWIDGDYRYAIVPFNPIVSGTRWDKAGTPKWIYFKDDKFGLIPRPDSTNTFELWYIPKYIVLSADSDVLQVPDDYITIPQLYATKMVLTVKGIEKDMAISLDMEYRRERKEFRKYSSNKGFVVNKREGFGSGYRTDTAFFR